MASSLHQVILDVADLDRSLAFYGNLLQLRVEECTRLDGCKMATLFTGCASIVLVQQQIEEGHYDRTGGVVLNFWVKDVVTLQSRLAHLGCPVLRGLERDKVGNQSILVADPDGFAVLLSERHTKLN